jgi:hypothetical protein
MTTMPSKPVRFNSGPNVPPQADSPHMPVNGDFAATAKRDDPGKPLAARGPVIIMSGARGASGSVLRSYCYKYSEAANELPPMNFLSVSFARITLEHAPFVKSTCKILPA